jgi:hypothetical protein
MSWGLDSIASVSIFFHSTFFTLHSKLRPVYVADLNDLRRYFVRP